MNLLQVSITILSKQITEQAKFTYSPLGKPFAKKTKTIEEQRKKQIKALEGNGKQFVKYSDFKSLLK